MNTSIDKNNTICVRLTKGERRQTQLVKKNFIPVSMEGGVPAKNRKGTKRLGV